VSLRVLLNPAAGRGAGARHQPRLAALAAEVGAGALRVTGGAADLVEEARRAAAEGVERLLVAGGDGTMHHVVQGLAGSGTALGVVPLGSGNDLAGTLGVPRDLGAAVRRAAGGPVRRIDLLRVGEHYTVGYAGVGFDAEVAQRVAAQSATAGARRGLGARLRGPLIYPWAVVQTLARFAPPVLRVTWDGGGFEGPAMFAVLANLPRFGGGMQIAPAARIDDGLLDVVIVRAIPRRTLLTVFPKVYSGRHVGHPAVLLARAARAEVTADRPLTMFGGGEPLLGLIPGRPVAAEVLPDGLAVAG
jgi:diacylglycerol kinase (ATP)